MNVTEIRRGRATVPIPFEHDTNVIRMEGCPDCNGRGWFLINPFATGGSNGAGGYRNMCQCLTCLDCQSYWNEHGTLPEGIMK